MVMSMLLAGAALAACGGSGGASPSPSASGAATAADKVAAVVNGASVRQSDVDSVRAERRFLKQKDDAAVALDEAIDRQLLRAEAARLDVPADPALVARRLAALTQEQGGAEALATALGSAGMSQEELRRSISDGLLREALTDEKFAAVAVAPGVVRAFYDRHRDTTFAQAASSHIGAILVRSKLVAENALSRLHAGRPFAEVARQLSIDPESKAAGGDLGWVLTSSLPGPLQSSVGGAGKGVIDKPLGGGATWYVVKVFAQRPAHAVPFAKVRRRLDAELTRLKRAKALEAWLAAARGRADISRP